MGVTSSAVGRLFTGASRRTQSLIGRGLRSVDRGVTNVFGTVQGNFEYNRLRAVMSSYHSRELFAENLEKADLRIMVRASKHLRAFNKKKFIKIQKRYSNHPNILRRVNELYVEKFIKSLEAFLESFKTLLEALQLSTKEADRLQKEFVSGMRDMLIKVTLLSRNGKFVIPPEVLEDVEKKLKKIGKTQINIYRNRRQKEKKIEKRIRGGKRIRSFFTTMVFGVNWVIFKSKRGLDKLGKRFFENLLEDYRELNKQISEERIQPDFFPRLQNYFKNMDKTELIVKDIRKDILSLLEVTERLYIDMKISMAQFVMLHQNAEGISVIRAEAKKLDVLQQFLIQGLKTGDATATQITKDVEKFVNRVPLLLTAIRKASDARLNSIKDVVGADRFLNE